MRVRSLILTAGAIAAVACSGNDNGGQGPGNETPEGDILVRNNLFQPAELEVEPGATVVWAWSSNGVVHNIVFDDGPTSGDRGSGTYERTFSALGDYPYLCSIHGASMSGVVNVVADPSPGDDGGGGNDDPDGPGYPGGGSGGY